MSYRRDNVILRSTVTDEGGWSGSYKNQGAHLVTVGKRARPLETTRSPGLSLQRAAITSIRPNTDARTQALLRLRLNRRRPEVHHAICDVDRHERRALNTVGAH